MGTSNFSYGNTTCIYAVETSFWDEELQEEVRDEFILEDTQDNIACDIENIAKKRGWDWAADDRIRVDGWRDRNYPSTSIGKLSTDFEFLGIYIEVGIIPKTTAGYYTGFSLDYDYRLTADSTDYEDAGELANNLLHHPSDFEVSAGLAKIHAGNLQKKIEDTFNKLKIEIEKVFKMYSTPLGIVGRFNNGETIYTECTAA